MTILTAIRRAIFALIAIVALSAATSRPAAATNFVYIGTSDRGETWYVDMDTAEYTRSEQKFVCTIQIDNTSAWVTIDWANQRYAVYDGTWGPWHRFTPNHMMYAVMTYLIDQTWEAQVPSGGQVTMLSPSVQAGDRPKGI